MDPRIEIFMYFKLVYIRAFSGSIFDKGLQVVRWKIDAVNLDQKIRLSQVPDRSNDGFKNEEVLDSAKLRGSCT